MLEQSKSHLSFFSSSIFIAENDKALKSFGLTELLYFKNIDSFETEFSAKQHLGLIILDLPAQKQDETLAFLRQSETFWLSTIFVCQASSLSTHLANGIWSEQSKSLAEFSETRKKQLAVNSTLVETAMMKLLSYLWVFKGATLLPAKSPQMQSLYWYPLLQAWGIKAEDSINWLASMVRRNWLEVDSLVNRVRYCQSCHSGHLNYVDTCPSCQSIDIGLKASLHCFNCGHVAAEHEFKQQIGLGCPNCSKPLRHIGVDYDRPIENQQCNSCFNLFVDSDVVADCMDCGEKNDVNNLIVQSVNSYKLSANGRNLAKFGEKFNSFMFDQAENINFTQFCWLLQWQNTLALRHKQEHSVVYITMENVEQFIQDKGEKVAFSLFDELEQRIAKSIRLTDICCVQEEHSLLLFLPLTPLAQLPKIYQKLNEIELLQSDKNIALSIKALPLPDKSMSDDVNMWLFEALEQARSIEF